MKVTCGWCGTELDHLGSDHSCDARRKVDAAISTGSLDPILNDD